MFVLIEEITKERKLINKMFKIYAKNNMLIIKKYKIKKINNTLKNKYYNNP